MKKIIIISLLLAVASVSNAALADCDPFAQLCGGFHGTKINGDDKGVLGSGL